MIDEAPSERALAASVSPRPRPTSKSGGSRAEDKSHATFTLAVISSHRKNALPAERERTVGAAPRPAPPPSPPAPPHWLLSPASRLGCGGAEAGRDQPRRPHLSHRAQKVCHQFLGEAFLGRTLPAVRRAEKIRAEPPGVPRHRLSGGAVTPALQPICSTMFCTF